MTETDYTKIHIYAPPVTNQSYRVLGKRCRKFDGGPFGDFESALNHGLKTFPDGFRVFLQSCYEWHDPYNKLVAKIGSRKDVTWRAPTAEQPGGWIDVVKVYDIPEKPWEWTWQYFEDGEWSRDHEWSELVISESYAKRYDMVERLPHRCRRKP